MKINKPLARGFTLLEITVVLFILGLMIAGLFGPLETQLEARDRRQTQDALQQILEALYGYALTHGRLPCPDTDPDKDGRPNPEFYKDKPETAICTATVGILPWSELAVPQGDAWGNRFTYAVSNPAYTRPDTDGLCNGRVDHFDLCTTGALRVESRGDDPSSPSTQEGKARLKTYATGLPAVVISHGRNGFGAQTITGVELPELTGDDERQTFRVVGRDKEKPFMSRGYSRGSSGCDDNGPENTPLCEYDDLVVWLAPTILNGRMVSAGRLP